jgi:ABC-type nitrate/sulfonate/bicarbonate transport system substrate-binding protein
MPRQPRYNPNRSSKIRKIALDKHRKNQQPPAEKTVVRVGYIDLPAPIFIAKDKGHFEKTKLDVQLLKFSNSNLLIEALERGELHATAPIGYSTLFAFENLLVSS